MGEGGGRRGGGGGINGKKEVANNITMVESQERSTLFKNASKIIFILAFLLVSYQQDSCYQPL